jgi:hypothetical protein
MLLGLLPANHPQFCLSWADPARSMEQRKMMTPNSGIPQLGDMPPVIITSPISKTVTHRALKNGHRSWSKYFNIHSPRPSLTDLANTKKGQCVSSPAQIITFPENTFLQTTSLAFRGKLLYLLHPLFTINGAAVDTAAPRAESLLNNAGFRSRDRAARPR